MAIGRIMALDVGDRRIGLAITDGLGLTAQPFFTLHRTKLNADLKSLGRFIRKQEVHTLVVGLPLHADGSPSPQAAKAQAFAAELFAQHPRLAHHLLDERLTTREAHALLDNGRRKRLTAHHRIERKHLIDQVAATLLLEAFLTHRNGPSLLPDPDGKDEPLYPESGDGEDPGDSGPSGDERNFGDEDISGNTRP